VTERSVVLEGSRAGKICLFVHAAEGGQLRAGTGGKRKFDHHKTTKDRLSTISKEKGKGKEKQRIWGNWSLQRKRSGRMEKKAESLSTRKRGAKKEHLTKDGNETAADSWYGGGGGGVSVPSIAVG